MSNATTPADEANTNPSNAFVAALAEMEFGNLVPDASERLTKLVSQVASCGRKGTFTLSLVVEPGKGTAQVKIISDIKVTPPKPEKGESLFWVSPHGQLLRKNPNQKEFPFAEDRPRVVRDPVAVGQ